jgi:hypothetical protein
VLESITSGATKNKETSQKDENMNLMDHVGRHKEVELQVQKLTGICCDILLYVQ